MNNALISPLDLSAADLMAHDVVTLRHDMPLRAAACLLLKHQIGGAPVVDGAGRCVGILTTTDITRLAEKRVNFADSLRPAQARTCSFQRVQIGKDGREVVRCTLPEGACAVQAKQSLRGEGDVLVCNQPNSVLMAWQNVDFESLPQDPVRQYMGSDPVTASPTTPVVVLAQKMIDAHIHRIVIVDTDCIPVGIVSTLDLLAALTADPRHELA